MELKDLLKKPLPPIPAEIKAALDDNQITDVPFEAKNRILLESDLQREVGYKRMHDGTYLVSVICPMPGITPQMLEWWFWWHPQADERYQVWFPNDHYRISYDRRDNDYFRQDIQPRFRNNTQYPTERIGNMTMPLRIDFVSPEEFGFSRAVMDECSVPLIICGHVGVFRGLIWHTEMAHIFRQTDNGSVLISRFWIGQTLKNPILRKLILNDKTARGMAEHCCVEYRNLAEILPVLYAKENAGIQPR